MAITRSTAKARNVSLGGAFQTCEECAMSKARQRGVHKKPMPRAKMPGKRLFVDIAQLTYASKYRRVKALDLGH